MRPDAKLVAIEISSDFVEVLREQFPDPRVHVHHGSATEIEAALAKIGERSADLGMSGIPFSTLEHGVGLATLRAAKRGLSPGGRFVGYPFRRKGRDFRRPGFGPRPGRPARLRKRPP